LLKTRTKTRVKQLEELYVQTVTLHKNLLKSNRVTVCMLHAITVSKMSFHRACHSVRVCVRSHLACVHVLGERERVRERRRERETRER